MKINKKRKRIHGSVARSDPGRPSPARTGAGTKFKRARAAREAAHGLAQHAGDVGLARLTQPVDLRSNGRRAPASPDISETAAMISRTSGDGFDRDLVLRTRLDEIYRSVVVAEGMVTTKCRHLR